MKKNLDIKLDIKLKQLLNLNVNISGYRGEAVSVPQDKFQLEWLQWDGDKINTTVNKIVNKEEAIEKYGNFYVAGIEMVEVFRTKLISYQIMSDPSKIHQNIMDELSAYGWEFKDLKEIEEHENFNKETNTFKLKGPDEFAIFTRDKNGEFATIKVYENLK